MDLRTGTSLWHALGDSPVEYPSLAGDLDCHVAIIGGGITGALLGFLLTGEGVDAVVIDKRSPGQGSTMASTGLLQYETDTHLADLIRKRDRESAVHAYRRSLRAINELEQFVDQIGGGCGFARRSSLYFASTRWHVARLKREFACRQEHGFDVQWLDRKSLASFSSVAAPAAILAAGDAEIDPYEFTQRLLAHACRGGMRAYADSAVTSVVEDSGGVVLTTPTGSLTARSAVFCTGYEAHEHLRFPPGDLQSTYALASGPMTAFPGWPDKCLVWETSRPYFYARQTPDGRALIGGEDTAFSADHAQPGILEAKAQRLMQRFEKLFPEIPFEPAFAWAGTFAQTKDGLAYIGRLPKHQNLYAALGYGGNGITFGAIASRLIADLLLGRPNPDAEVFSFER